MESIHLLSNVNIFTILPFAGGLVLRTRTRVILIMFKKLIRACMHVLF